MTHFLRKAIFMCALAGAAGVAPAAFCQSPTVAKVKDLIRRLQASEERRQRGGTAERIRFELSEAEINQYATEALRTTPRPGVESVAVKVFPHNYISTLTLVDFDAVERWKPGTIPGPLRPVLSGKKSIWVDYRFQASDRKASFTIEKAYFGNVRLPAFVVEKMIQVVAARQPEHYDTSKPLPLPFGLRSVGTNEKSIVGEN